MPLLGTAFVSSVLTGLAASHFNEKTDRSALEALDRGGIRAVRVFLGLTANVDVAQAAQRIAPVEQQIKGLPW